MCNLRSDCRALVAHLPHGDTIRSHMERACYQIDQVEKMWHEAEIKAHRLEEELAELKRGRADQSSPAPGPPPGDVDLDDFGRRIEAFYTLARSGWGGRNPESMPEPLRSDLALYRIHTGRMPGDVARAQTVAQIIDSVFVAALRPLLDLRDRQVPELQARLIEALERAEKAEANVVELRVSARDLRIAWEGDKPDHIAASIWDALWRMWGTARIHEMMRLRMTQADRKAAGLEEEG